MMLLIGKLANWNARLSIWDLGYAKIQQVFLNQALNTSTVFACRSTSALESQLINIKGASNV